jgi:hypothetical protein
MGNSFFNLFFFSYFNLIRKKNQDPPPPLPPKDHGLPPPIPPKDIERNIPSKDKLVDDEHAPPLPPKNSLLPLPLPKKELTSAPPPPLPPKDLDLNSHQVLNNDKSEGVSRFFFSFPLILSLNRIQQTDKGNRTICEESYKTTKSTT